MQTIWSKLIRIAVFIFVFSNSLSAQVSNREILKFRQVINLISTQYVDSVSNSELIKTAIVSVLKELDPHSTYVPKKDVKQMQERMRGNYEGIGVQFNILQDTIVVVAAIPGGPSEKVGIMAGDRIVKVEDEVVGGIGIDTEGVRKRLLGDKGTQVQVGIKRRKVKELLYFTITRDKIPDYSLDASYKITKNMGYIKLNRFSATTAEEFREALEKLENQGVNKLILDLRDNGGGYLQMAIEVCDEFLKKKQLILFTEGVNSPKLNYFATKKGRFIEGKLVILINEGSASASEIVSGAVQDWDRGVVIGRRSFGKGLVQRPFNLFDGEILRLTIARYYTPSGRLIQKSYAAGDAAYRKDLYNRYSNGELLNQDSIHFSDSLKFFTLKNKRIVYGAGGIMPDIFVPIDTTGISTDYLELSRSGIINRFIISYLDENRARLHEQYPDFKKFKAKFEIDSIFQKKLFAFAEKENNEATEKNYDFSKREMFIKQQMKAILARDLWSRSEYFEIMNEKDPAVQRAVKLLNNKKEYNKKLHN